MAPNRDPAPVGQPRTSHATIDEGTLARTPTPGPATIGGPSTTGGTPTPSRVVATGACAYLNPRSRGTVQAPQASFDRLRGLSGNATISAARANASYAWPYGAASAAVEQDVAIDGHSIVVVRPTDADASGKNLPTTAQLAEALRALPARQRVLTRRVNLSPTPHPNTTATETTAGEAGSGVITLFPMGSAQSQNDFDNRVMHESGHNFQGTLWNSVTAVAEWQLVATNDVRRPSAYAASNAGDDFCEFGILFNAAKATPCEATARGIYPNRWAKMVEYEARP